MMGVMNRRSVLAGCLATGAIVSPLTRALAQSVGGPLEGEFDKAFGGLGQSPAPVATAALPVEPAPIVPSLPMEAPLDPAYNARLIEIARREIERAVAAGFKKDASSEMNANPKDTKDYADGVWALPPTLRGGDKDKEKFLAIGESDRMTIRFVKPLKAKK